MSRLFCFIFSILFANLHGYLVPSNLADEKYFNGSLQNEYTESQETSNISKGAPLISTIIVEPNGGQGSTKWTNEVTELRQLAVGKPAPYFKAEGVIEGDFATASSDDYKGKYVVLIFYPGLFSYVCPTELIAFSDRIDEFRKINAEVVTISTNAKFAHLTATKIPRKERGLGEMRIPLLSDENHKISKSYGILNEEKGTSYRGSFIIDGKGIIRQITINDKQVGRSVDEALRLVQGYQKSDKEEVFCPVDWHPGDECMKPNLKDSLEYYQKHY